MISVVRTEYTRALSLGFASMLVFLGIRSSAHSAPLLSHLESAYSARGHEVNPIPVGSGPSIEVTGSWTRFSVYEARIHSGQINVESRWDIEPPVGPVTHGLIERAHGWFTVPDYQPNLSDPSETTAFGKMFCFARDDYKYPGGITYVVPEDPFQLGINVNEAHWVIGDNEIETSLRRSHCQFCESGDSVLVCNLNLNENYGMPTSFSATRTFEDPYPTGWSTHPEITEIRGGVGFTDDDLENKIWVHNQTLRYTHPDCEGSVCDLFADDATPFSSLGDIEAENGVVVWGGGGRHLCRGDSPSYENRENRCEKPTEECTSSNIGEGFPNATFGSWKCVGVYYNCWDTPNHEATPPPGVGLSSVPPVPTTVYTCGACGVFDFFGGPLEDALHTVATDDDDWWHCPGNGGTYEYEIWMPASAEWPVDEWRYPADKGGPSDDFHIERYNGWSLDEEEERKRCWGDKIPIDGTTYQWVQVYREDHPSCP